MPPKKGNRKNDKLEEIFRAVVICDDFDDSFYPITFESPKCLLPIANRPTLAYVLDHLVFRCKFQEILLVSNKYGDVIKKFVQSNYKGNYFFSFRLNSFLVNNICKIEYLSSSEFESLGDIFRCFDRDNMVSKGSRIRMKETKQIRTTVCSPLWKRHHEYQHSKSIRRFLESHRAQPECCSSYGAVKVLLVR